MLYSEFKSLVAKMRETQDALSDAEPFSQKARELWTRKLELEQKVDAILDGELPQNLF